jgi:hypothetical protein
MTPTTMVQADRQNPSITTFWPDLRSVSSRSRYGPISPPRSLVIQTVAEEGKAEAVTRAAPSTAADIRMDVPICDASRPAFLTDQPGDAIALRKNKFLPLRNLQRSADRGLRSSRYRLRSHHRTDPILHRARRFSIPPCCDDGQELFKLIARPHRGAVPPLNLRINPQDAVTREPREAAAQRAWSSCRKAPRWDLKGQGSDAGSQLQA